MEIPPLGIFPSGSPVPVGFPPPADFGGVGVGIRPRGGAGAVAAGFGLAVVEGFRDFAPGEITPVLVLRSFMPLTAVTSNPGGSKGACIVLLPDALPLIVRGRQPHAACPPRGDMWAPQ